MKVEGVREFDAAPEVVWEVLMDPKRISALMPGVEGCEVQDSDHWTANVKVPLGVGGLKLKFKFEQVEKRPIEYAKLSAKGQGVGAVVNMQTEFHLAPNDGRTSMRWEADVRIGGPIGSMGQRVFQPIVNQQITGVLDALDAECARAKAG
jgi:carbon monoxide dehydrogenase subunit G